MENLFKNTFPLGKKYFSLAKKKVSTSRNKVSLKKLLPPNFKIFNKALNKTILSLLDRKFVSTSLNKEFVKKTFPFEGETAFTAWSI